MRSYLAAALILAGVLSAIQDPSSSTTPRALGHVELSSTSTGPTWTDATIPSGLGPLYAISCTVSSLGATDCVAVGQTTGGHGAAIETTNGGSTWSSDTVPSGAPPLLAVSCSAPGACVAVGGGSSLSTGGIYLQSSPGGSFVAETEPTGNGEVDAVSCPTSSYCTAIGYNTTTDYFDNLLASTNGGATWSGASSAVTISSHWVSLDSLQCLSASTCVASGTGYYGPSFVWTTNAWSSYSGSYNGSSAAYLDALSCPNTGYCVAAGLADTLTGTPTGGSWTESANPTGIGQILGDLCVSSTTCALVGNTSSGTSPVNGNGAILATANGGTTWSSESPPSGTGTLFGVGCSPTGVCFSVGESYVSGSNGNAVLLTDNGDVLDTGTSVAPAGSSYTADARALGSPSEVTVDQNAWIGSAGDPVNTATGDFSDTLTDLVVPGAGVPLTFTRTYDAEAAQSEEGGSVPPLGYGWSDNFGLSLSYNSVSGIATITEEDGTQVSFTSSMAAAWCSGLATNFCGSSPRIEATLNENGGGTSWTFTRLDGAKDTFTFSSSGVLQSIADANGDTLTPSTYGGSSPSCPTGDTCVGWTSSASGRELVLAANSSSQLVEVFVVGTTTDKVTYAYSATGCSWGAMTPALCSVTDPLGNTTSYTYDSGNANATLDYDILTLTPPGGIGDWVNTYDTLGRVTGQTDPAGDVTKFLYGTGASGQTTTTVSTYPSGTSNPADVTEFDYWNNVLTSEVTGVNTGDPAVQNFVRGTAPLLDSSYSDGDGNSTANTFAPDVSSGVPSASDVLTSTDGLGNTTLDAYNAVNQVWCSVDPADYANGTRCPTISPPTSIPATSYPGTTINVYNTSDQLVATIDPLGNTTTYSYTSSGGSEPARLMYCSVDPADYKNGVTCPAYGATHVTGTATKTFDSAGDVLNSTDADGHVTSYTYSTTNPGLVATETSPDGTVTTYTYNASGQTTLETVSFGSYSATTQYGYDSAERQVCEVAPYEYAASVRCPTSTITTPTPSSDLYLGATITTYNDDNQVTQTTNPLGGITYTAYNPAGQVYCTVAPYEAAHSVTCPALPITTPTVGSDSYLGATITNYNASGEVVQTTNPLGGITLTTYDSAGNVLTTTVESNNSTTDPNLVTTYSYNADNEVYETVVGSGASAATTLESYDPNGNVFCSVSANAYKSGTYQCPTWQTSWITAPPSPSALYSTTPTSAQANNVTTAFYNADGNVVQSTNADVETSISAFDPDARTYCTSDPVNVTAWLTAHSSSTYPYLCPSTPPTSAPSLGSEPGYTTTIYDPAGLTLSTTDQFGNTTSYAYDSAGIKASTTDASGSATQFCYYYQNSSGQCAHAAPTTGGTGNSLYSQTLQSGETTTYTYYPGGVAEATTSPAGTTTDAYDALGDLTSETYSATATGYATPPNVTYTYYVDGTRDTMTDGTGTTTYTPDANGDVTSQAFSAGSGTGLSSNTTSYTYFSTGQLASVVYPSYTGHSTPSVTYTYDSLGNMASETDWLGNEVTFSHDGDGNLTAQDNAVSGSYPSGTSSTSYSYDNADFNSAATSSLAQTCGGSETLTQSFSGSTGSRNQDGQVTEDSEAYSGSCSGQTGYERNYSYGPNGRLIYQGSTAQGASADNFAYTPEDVPTEISSHDSSGNFDTYNQTVNSTEAVTSQTPISGSHGVSSSYAYDTLGDLSSSTSSSATTGYSYDSIGQMTGLSNSAGIVGYQYTGDGLEAAAAGQIGWGAPQSIEGTYVLETVSCTSSSFCAAVDNGNALIYNGTSWTRTSIDGSNTIFGVSCTSSSFCAAVDGDGNVLTYNGTSWTKSDVDGTTPFYAPPSCVSSSFCVAVDSDGNAFVYNGSSWAKTDIDGSYILYDVSCTSSSFCVAVDQDGNALKYNGSSWAKSDIDSTYALFGVSCSSSSFCMAVDQVGNALAYNGTSWTTTDADGTTPVEKVSCTSSSFCMAVDQVGNALAYNGTSWTTKNIDGTNYVSGVSCTSSSFCIAVDVDGNALAYNGTSWSSQTPDGRYFPEGVSCTSTTFCVAVDNGYALVYNGTTWTRTHIDGSNTLFGVSCVSSSFCVAVDADGNALTYNGTSWSTSDIDGSTPFYAPPSCVSTSFCVAVDSVGDALVYNGSTWAKTDIDGTTLMFGVSCKSSSFCVAVDTVGDALVYNGTTWTRTDIDGTYSLYGVSCTSTSFCVAVDWGGDTLTYNGTSWTKTNIEPNSLKSVSCTSTTSCVAGDDDGNTLVYNGTSWATKNVDRTNNVSGVSCTSSSFCVAVDWGGNAMIYSQSVTGSEQLTWNRTASLPLVLSDGTNYYVYGPTGEPVEQVNVTASPPTNNPVFLTFTPTDSSWLVTNTSGDELSYYRYDAYGTLALGTPDSPYGFAGQYSDTSSDPSGFDNMRARWYEAQTGQFTTVDPDFEATDQAYDYAGDNPVNSADPSGLTSCGANPEPTDSRFYCRVIVENYELTGPSILYPINTWVYDVTWATFAFVWECQIFCLPPTLAIQLTPKGNQYFKGESASNNTDSCSAGLGVWGGYISPACYISVGNVEENYACVEGENAGRWSLNVTYWFDASGYGTEEAFLRVYIWSPRPGLIVDTGQCR